MVISEDLECIKIKKKEKEKRTAIYQLSTLNPCLPIKDKSPADDALPTSPCSDQPPLPQISL